MASNQIWLKILAGIMVLVSGVAGIFLLLPLLNVVSLRLLQAGPLEGVGRNQALRTLIGIPLAMALGAAWLTFSLYVSDYYHKGVKHGVLGRRIALVTAIQLLLVPVVVVVQQAALPGPMLFTDWLILSGGMFLGVFSLYVYYGTKTLQKKK